jgi:hypothetical protein
MKAIDKVGGKGMHIGMIGVDFELIDYGGEFLNIINDRGVLLNVEHLAEQGFTLIVGKMIQQKFAKITLRKLTRTFYRLDPTFRYSIEMHTGHFDPQIGRNAIHV